MSRSQFRKFEQVLGWGGFVAACMIANYILFTLTIS